MQVNRAIWKVWFFAAVFFPLTISLGTWQLDRAEEKDELSRDFELAMKAKPVQWSNSQSLDVGRFRTFQMSGVFLPEFSFLLDNRTHQGRPGYEVLTPLEVGQSTILVNRGWVPAPAYRSQLPSVSAPESKVDLIGYFYFPETTTPVLDEAVTGEEVWPKRIQRLDWSMMDEALSRNLAVNHQFRLLDHTQPGAFEINWSKSSLMPDKHRGYAVQWFSMAVVLVLLTLWATLKLRNKNNET